MTAGDRKLNRKFLADFDWQLCLAAVALTALGIIEIYSAQPAEEYWLKQLIWVGLGLVVMILSTVIDYRRVAEAAWLIYGVALVLLILVLLFGEERNGAKAWFSIGGIGGQPSEFAKIATILAVAVYLAKVREQKKGRKEDYLILREIVIASGIILPPVGLIALQPDHGTALTFFAALGGMVFVSGLRPRLIVTGLVLAAVAGSVGWQLRHRFLKPYQLQRIEVVLHPEKADPRGYGYQTRQSNIAVGSGGLLGKGFTKGTQSRLKFLPFPETDFIASVVAEETGLIGMLIVLALYWLILMKSLGHAERSRDQLGMVLITGLVCLLGFHVVVNIGMVVGLLPIMGIPLPLMSYGGSSILATYLGLGLIASVRFHRHVN
jgi:rod shape determining protein RodA